MPAVHRMAVFHRQIHLKYFLLPATKSQENMLLLFPVFLFAETMINFSGELSFNQKIITEVHPFEAPVLTRFKLKSVKILGLAAE